LRLPVSESSPSQVAKPKSRTLAPDFVSMMLPGFRQQTYRLHKIRSSRDIAARSACLGTRSGGLIDNCKLDPRAYDLYLRGSYHLGRVTAQDTYQAIALYEQAAGGYLPRFTFMAAVLPNPTQLDEKSFISRTLTIAETKAELAGFHL
jgi:hypothetical protein